MRKWALDEEAADPIVRRAVDSGVTFFDTADVYSQGVSEQITGRLLPRFFGRRDDYVLATKICMPMGDGRNDRGLSRKHIMVGIDDSLRRLGTDYVDLYQIHRWDYETPIEETMEALHDVVKSGRARYIGASSMYAWQFAKAQHVAETHGWTKFVSMQNHYNLVYREEEREMNPLCLDQGVGLIPWSPLARGCSPGTGSGAVSARPSGPGTTRSGTASTAKPTSTSSTPCARSRRSAVPAAQVALAWLLGRPGVTAPIVGATKLTHMDDAIAAESLELDEKEAVRLEAPYRPRAVLGHS